MKINLSSQNDFNPHRIGIARAKVGAFTFLLRMNVKWETAWEMVHSRRCADIRSYWDIDNVLPELRTQVELQDDRDARSLRHASFYGEVL